MKYLTYNDFKINELLEATRLDKYIKDNPSYIKDFDTNPPVKNDFKYTYEHILDNKEIFDIKQKYINRNPLLNKSFYTIGTNEKPQEYMLRKYVLIDISYIDTYINKDFDKFIDKLNGWEFKKKYFNDDVLSEFRDNWSVLYKQLNNYSKEIKAYEYRLSNKLNKIAKRKGVTKETLVNSIDWLIHFTSKSSKKIPNNIHKALNHITVDKNDYPLTVYRGIFYDGIKIKDKEKFLKKWYKGAKPKIKNRKATSWSTDINVAKSFMISQDMIKDDENGYHILLKYDIINHNDVVADLRKLDWLGFWSQQEILLSPSAIDYVVLEMFPFSEGNDNSPYSTYIGNKNLSNYGGMSGKNIKSIIRDDLFNAMLSNLPYNKKMEILSYKDKKVKDAKDIFDLNSGYEHLGELYIPLYQLIKDMWAGIDDVISSDTAKISINNIYGDKNKQYKSKNIIIRSLYRQPLNFVFEIDFSNVDIDNGDITVDDIIKKIENGYHITKNKNVKIKYIR